MSLKCIGASQRPQRIGWLVVMARCLRWLCPNSRLQVLAILQRGPGMSDAITRGMFQALVSRAGGVEAVAAVLEARFGCGHKGTVSKMISGQLAVTVDAAVAVEAHAVRGIRQVFRREPEVE